jgi:hypothetical protein
VSTTGSMTAAVSVSVFGAGVSVFLLQFIKKNDNDPSKINFFIPNVIINSNFNVLN